MPIRGRSGRPSVSGTTSSARHAPAPDVATAPEAPATEPKTSRPLAVITTLVTRTVTSLSDQPSRALHDHHRAVVEIADTLTGFPAGLDQLDDDVLADDHRRPQRQRQRVQVQDADAGERGDLGEVGVEGEQRVVVIEAHPDQLGVDVTHRGMRSRQ